MNRQDLPGIDELFREHDRLAKKLSQAELNALRRYLHRTVHTECEAVVARMRYLQATHDVSEKQFQQALDMMQKDLQREQGIASEFKREFASLARVFKSRDQRHQAQHDTMVNEVRRCKELLKEANQVKEKLEIEVCGKEKEILQFKDMIVDLEDQLAKHKGCDKLSQEVDRLTREVLTLKIDKDKLARKVLERADTALEQRPTTNATVVAPLQPMRRQPSLGGSLKSSLKTSQPGMSVKKNLQMLATDIPCCTVSKCRAQIDLEDCRKQFIKKCEEVAYLKYVISEQKRKSREERTRLFSNGQLASDNKTVTVSQNGEQLRQRERAKSQRVTFKEPANQHSSLHSRCRPITLTFKK